MGNAGKIFLSLMALLAVTPAASMPARAQAQPEVEIDSSVLQQLAPAGGTSASTPVFRQTQQKIVPMAATPQGSDPAKPYAMRRTGNIQPIVPREQPRPMAAAPAAQPFLTAPGIKAFPVQKTVRSNSLDPAGAGGQTKSAGTSLSPASIAPQEIPSAPPALRPVPPPAPSLEKTAPSPKRAAKADPKVPARKPAAKTAKAIMPIPPRKPTSLRAMADNDVLPVPAIRPDDVKLAGAPPLTADTGTDLGIPDVTAPLPETLVAAEPEPIPATAIAEKPVQKKSEPAKIAAVREKEVIRGSVGLPATNLPPPPRPGRMAPSVAGSLPNAPKVMPAVPTRNVGAETLPAMPGFEVADANDPLLMQLTELDRQHFIKQVEGITAGLAPIPARKPVRGGMPPSLNKTNMAVLVPRGEPSMPGPLTRQDLATATNTANAAAALAAIAPAAGGDKFASDKIDMKPRPPAATDKYESAYISVPFMPGDEKATEAVISRLEAEVIPVLRQNPGWRVQIQAFSSPDNEVRSSARRTALSRALSVREYLIEQGVDAPRMDIRALGMETDRDPLDRIDLVFFDPAKSS